MDSRLGLPKNTVLDGSYRIERLIGSGGFGITYRAEDINLKTTVALKEYYPGEFGQRDSNLSVRPKSERHKATFDWGRTSFLREAQTLARFRHPGIVRVSRVFEANATAYMVMDFEQGQSFEAWLESLGRRPTQAELDRIVAPLLDALETLHAADLLHRDIAPDNILIRQDGTPVLLDFGAARRAVAEMSRALTGIIKVGYSPHEQYAADGRYQGPWSDLYALGATLYKAVAGKKPEESTLRMADDRMLPAAEVGKGAFRPGFLAAIDACLAVTAAKRPQSVAELQADAAGRSPALRSSVEARGRHRSDVRHAAGPATPGSWRTRILLGGTRALARIGRGAAGRRGRASISAQSSPGARRWSPPRSRPGAPPTPRPSARPTRQPQSVRLRSRPRRSVPRRRGAARPRWRRRAARRRTLAARPRQSAKPRPRRKPSAARSRRRMPPSGRRRSRPRPPRKPRRRPTSPSGSPHPPRGTRTACPTRRRG